MLFRSLSAKSQQELYEQQLLQAKSQVVSSLSTLQTLINSQICTIKTLQFLGYPTIPDIGTQSERDFSEAIRLSPSLASLDASVKAAGSLAKYYKRSYLPTISAQVGVSGTYERGNISGIGTVSNQYSNNTEPFEIGRAHV